MLTREEVARMPRAERLERLGRAGHALDAAVADRPEAVLCRRPDEKNWAPKEIVCHLRDTEEFFMLRFQMLAAAHEPPLAAPKATNRASLAAEIQSPGCHCTPTQKRRPGSSIASITPSGARPLTTPPGPLTPAA